LYSEWPFGSTGYFIFAGHEKQRSPRDRNTTEKNEGSGIFYTFSLEMVPTDRYTLYREHIALNLSESLASGSETES
jgi:hypothetical protein